MPGTVCEVTDTIGQSGFIVYAFSRNGVETLWRLMEEMNIEADAELLTLVSESIVHLPDRAGECTCTC